MKISKLIVRLGLILLALVVVAEILVRLVFPQPLDPGRNFILENEIPGLKSSVTIRLDANQVRGFNSGSAKPAGSLRILCVGGTASMTMLQNDEDTWWGQLETQLGKSLGKQVQVGAISAPVSVEAIGASQWVDHLLESVDGVDLVIGMFGRSEVLHPTADFRFDPKAVPPAQIKKKGGLMFGLAKASHLVRVVRNMHIKSKRNEQQSMYGKANFLRDRFTAAGQSYRSIPETTSAPPRAEDPISAYLYGIGALIEVAKQGGVKLLLVGEPTIFSALPLPEAAAALHTPVSIGSGKTDLARPLPGWVESELARYYGAAAKVSDGVGVPFVNLQGAILPTREHFFTESNLTDVGAAAVATALVPEVSKILK